MKIGFSTLGCPSWDLDTICAKGQPFGFDGVDFRGMQDEIDVTVLPEFNEGLGDTKRKLDEAGLVVSGIASSIRICDEANFDKNIEEAGRTIPIARELNAAVIRVFGAGDVEAFSREELATVGQRTMAALLALDGARGFKWALETHDHWISSTDCKLLLDHIPDEAFGILWDMGHTTRVTEEAPAQTLDAFGERVFCLHVKDAVHDAAHPQAMGDGWRYVAPGAGQLPLAEAIGLLRDRGYDGWMLFEHEKRWHPELPEPEEAFPKFADWAKSLL